MSDDKEDKKLRIETAHAVGKPLPPRTIAAQSQAWNSAAKIMVLGGALFCLLVLTGSLCSSVPKRCGICSGLPSP